MPVPTIRLLRRLQVLLAAAGLLVTSAAATTLAPNAARVAEIADRIVQQAASQADFNGAVVLMRDGQVIYERAVGLAQRGPDRVFTPDTPSDGGSLAKTLTAAALWELVAEGRLSYSDPVQRHLPDYPYPQHTLRDLVTHRSGLPDYGFFDRDFKPGQVRDTADLLRVLQRRRPSAAAAWLPRVEYDNLGFDTAALVVEKVTGSRIEAWWRERYFKPLGIEGMYARQRCHYSGAYNGFYSQLYWDRARREVVAYVSNSTLPPWRCARLTRDLIDALAGREPPPETVNPQRVAIKDLPRWAGAYTSPTLGGLTINTRGGRGFVKVGGGELASMFPLPGGLYYAPTLDLWLAFTGQAAAPTLHLRSVFHTAQAQRNSAAAGKTQAGEKTP